VFQSAACVSVHIRILFSNCIIIITRWTLPNKSTQTHIFDTANLHGHDTLTLYVHYRLHDCKDYTSNTNIPVILVGTNCQVTDEQRKVSFERAAKYAESEGLPYMELSRDSDTTVMPLINRMLELVIESFNNDQMLTKQQSDNVVLEQKKTTKSTCAC
jgi:hypothetical protein